MRRLVQTGLALLRMIAGMVASALVTFVTGIIVILLHYRWESGWLLLTLDDRRLEGRFLDLGLAAFVVLLLGPLLTLILRWRRWETWWSYSLAFGGDGYPDGMWQWR